MAGLHSTVYLLVDGETRGYGPGDDVPEHVARQIGAHAFEDGVHPFPDGDGDGETDRASGTEPARSGKGSGKDAWVAFAREKQFNLDGDPSRDEIIQRMVDAGIIQAQ